MKKSLTNIRYFLLDMDGTFYLGNQLLEGAIDFIHLLNKQGKDFIFLTNNSSKQRKQYAEKITRLGLPIADEKIFTSGEATAIYLNKTYANSSLYVAGTPALEEEFRTHGFRLVKDHPDLVVLGFDTTLTYQKLWDLCNFVRAGLPYIATHPDLNCPTENGFMPDIGAMIAFIKASTGREPDLIVGKPNRMIVDALAQKLDWKIQDMAMIGDRLYTDIALSQTAGIVTCLVLSGETKPEDVKNSPYQPTYIFDNLGAVAASLSVNE